MSRRAIPAGDPKALREAVRVRYAEAAARASTPASDCECGCPSVDVPGPGAESFGGGLYDADAVRGVPTQAVAASLGCGVPTAVAALQPGETVLDLGSGAGADVLISALRVGPKGRAIGLDMTLEMLELARRNAAAAGVGNAEFLHGYLEAIPLADAIVDVAISNCVINLAADKTLVLTEVFRVLRAGGRLAVSDVLADTDLDDATREDLGSWTGCIAGALTRDQYLEALGEAGFVDVTIEPTHRVHTHAYAAVVRAYKPSGSAQG